MAHRRAVPFLTFAVFATAACGHKAQPETPAPEPLPSAPAVTAPAAAATPVAHIDYEADAAMARRQAVLGQPILFGFDRADLSAEAKQVLDAKVAVLREDPNARLGIEGHADERGSDEYNLALGMRRATAAKRYMASRGLDDGRFETVSYGEERPAATGHDEASWSQNRRAAFTMGGAAVSAR